MNRNWKFFTLLAAVFSALALPTLIFQLETGCLAAYDLGIFSQHVLGAWRGEWDPFVPIRSLYLTQDHWDPITILVGWLLFPLSRLFGVPRLLIFFEVCVFIGAAGLLYFALIRRGFEASRARLAAITYFFAWVTWSAVLFPVHPTAWTILPMTALLLAAYDIIFERTNRWTSYLVVVSLLLLFLCGEQFSMAILGFAIGLALVESRRRFFSIGIFMLSLVMVWWAFRGRQLLHGGVFNYEGRLSWDLWILAAKYKFDTDFWKRLLSGAAGLVLPLWIAFSWISSRPKMWGKEARFVFVSALMSGPLLLGRFLAANWDFHYGVAWLPFMAAFFFVGRKAWRPGRRLALGLSALTILSSLTNWSQSLRLMAGSTPSCSSMTSKVSRDLLKSRQEEIRQMLDKIRPGESILAGMFLATNVLDRYGDGVEVFSFGPFRIADHVSQFDHVWISTGSFGNNWPFDQSDFGSLRETLRLQSEPLVGGSTELWTGPYDAGHFRSFGAEQVLSGHPRR